MNNQKQIHNIPPIFDENSEILILGSFPSVKSREQQFFYGHTQNRFWKVCSAIFNEALPKTIDEKKAFLLRNHIALWDVIKSCDIVGSSDSSIRNAIPNDITTIINSANIRQIYCNGKSAYNLYNKLIEPVISRKALCLPSTSPANAVFSLDSLIEKWSAIILKNEKNF